MAKGKQRKPATFQAKVTAGTPNHREEAVKNSPSTAKNWLLDRLEHRKAWADRYSLATADELAVIRTEISDIDPRGLHVGEERIWSTIDEYSKVEFVFSLTLESL